MPLIVLVSPNELGNSLSVTAGQRTPSQAEIEAQLTALVLNTVSSPHSRRAHRTGLERFFA